MGPICRWRDERGSATAELVIATPLLLLLILGIVQFALWEHATHVAQAVAEQGLSAGRVQGGTDQAASAEAQRMLGQLGSGVLVHPNVTRPVASPPRRSSSRAKPKESCRSSVCRCARWRPGRPSGSRLPGRGHETGPPTLAQ